MAIKNLKKIWEFLSQISGVIATLGLFVFCFKYLLKIALTLFKTNLLLFIILLVFIFLATIFLILTGKKKVSAFINYWKEEGEKEKREKVEKFKQYIYNNTEPASLVDYKKFLEGYKKIGGRVLDYKIDSSRLRLVEKEISIPSLCGNDRMDFIIKEGGKINLLDGKTNQCGFFYLKDYSSPGMLPGNI